MKYIENNLRKIFGSSIGLERKDGYLGERSYEYSSLNDTFITDQLGGGFSYNAIYNYEIISYENTNETIIMKIKGLYISASNTGALNFSNETGFSIVSEDLKDIEMAQKLAQNTDKMLLFEYKFKKIDSTTEPTEYVYDNPSQYILTEFRVIN